jgi:hypothetical protein
MSTRMRSDFAPISRPDWPHNSQFSRPFKNAQRSRQIAKPLIDAPRRARFEILDGIPNRTRKAGSGTPAMETGLGDSVWDMEELVTQIESKPIRGEV